MTHNKDNFAGIYRDSLQGITGTARTVLLTILVECNHTDNPEFKLDNKIYPLKRGQWIASAKRISELTGLTRQQVRNALNTTTRLTITSTIRATSKATLYTIENVDKYLVKKKEQPADQPPQQHTPNQQLTTNNKDTNKEPNKKTNKSKGERLPYQNLPNEWLPFCQDEMGWNIEQAESAFVSFYDYNNSPDCKNPLRKDWFMVFKNSCRNGITKPNINFNRGQNNDRANNSKLAGFANAIAEA